MSCAAPMATELSKRCNACGRSYDRDAWEALRLVGYMPVAACEPTADDDGREQLLQLRNCACGSTIAIDLLGDR